MTDRAAGQRSWTLSPTDLYVSYGSSGQGADWFGPLEPMKPLAPPEVAGRQWDYPAGSVGDAALVAQQIEDAISAGQSVRGTDGKLYVSSAIVCSALGGSVSGTGVVQ